MEEAEAEMLVAWITPDYPQINQEREERNAFDLSFITWFYAFVIFFFLMTWEWQVILKARHEGNVSKIKNFWNEGITTNQSISWPVYKHVYGATYSEKLKTGSKEGKQKLGRWGPAVHELAAEKQKCKEA